MSEGVAVHSPPLQAQSLATFEAGQGAIIMAVTGGRRLQERMVALGLFPGQRVTVCQNNGSSLVVSLNGSRLVLGRGVSYKILATPSRSDCRQAEICPCRAEASDKLT